MYSQYCRIESKAGGVFAPPRRMIKAFRTILSAEGKSRQCRAYRHALIGEPRQRRLRSEEVWRWGCISGRHTSFVYCFSRLYTTPQSHTSYQTLLQVTPRVEPPQVSSWAPGAISAGRQPRNVHRVSVLRPRFATAGRP